MKKLAFAALLCGAFGLVACGGDDGDDNGNGNGNGPGGLADSGPSDDGGGPDACNPVSQTGCDAGEKCAQFIESREPFLARTTCVPDGDASEGEACMIGDGSEEATGADNCEAGLACSGGACVGICSTDDLTTCGEDESCVLYENTFDDVGNDNIGLCAPACDPTTQTLLEDGTGGDVPCPNGGGCYLSVSLGTSSCARVPAQAEGLTMDDACYGPTTDSCYLNGCDAGYQAFWTDPSGVADSALCAAFCNHVDTYVEDGTLEGNLIGEAGGTQCAGGVVAGGQGQGDNPYSCRSIQWFGDAVRTGWGICASNQIELGDCTEFVKEDYVQGLSDDEEYCLDEPGDNMSFNVDRCPQACVSPETLDTWFEDPASLQRAHRDLLPVRTDEGLLIGGAKLITLP